MFDRVYTKLHATKPLDGCYGLNNSPVGLCAWLSKKFHGWSDPRRPIVPDELLVDITLYRGTQSIHSSMAIYQENAHRLLALGPHEYVRVPVGFAQFSYELPTPLRAYMEQGLNIQPWTMMTAGGHFAALEEPELLTADIKVFFQVIS